MCQKKMKICKKIEILNFMKKIENSWSNKIEICFIATRNNADTYYPSLKEMPWPLKLEKSKKGKNF